MPSRKGASQWSLIIGFHEAIKQAAIALRWST
jgi:hypothetical protein